MLFRHELGVYNVIKEHPFNILNVVACGNVVECIYQCICYSAISGYYLLLKSYFPWH